MLRWEVAHAILTFGNLTAHPGPTRTKLQIMSDLFDAHPYADRFPVNRTLPEHGRQPQEILSELRALAAEEDTAWEEGTDRSLLNYSIVGCVFKKSYYHGRDRHNVSEMVLADDLVLDPDDARVQATMATLDRLAAMPMAPALPQLGSALGELRNLRTTRALSRPIPAPIPNQGATP